MVIQLTDFYYGVWKGAGLINHVDELCIKPVKIVRHTAETCCYRLLYSFYISSSCLAEKYCCLLRNNLMLWQYDFNLSHFYHILH